MRALLLVVSTVIALPLPAFAAASNDDASNATAVTSLPFTDVLDTTGATVERGESTSSCAPAGATVWYRLDPVDASTVVSTEGSDFDTVVTARQGQTFEGAVVTACDDDAIGRQSRLVLQPTQDAVWLQVAGWGGATGTLRLTIAHAGTLTGVVSASGIGSIEDVCVAAVSASYVGADVTDTGGVFDIVDLMPGTYRVHITECVRRQRFAEMWVGGTDRDSATAFAVSPAATTPIAEIEVEPLPMGTISGRVVGPAANPQPLHVCVTTYWNGVAITRTWTDGDGRYETPALEQEAFLLRFDDRCGLEGVEDEQQVSGGPPVWPRWYRAPGDYKTTPVAVVGGTTVIVDAVLYVKMDYADLVVGTLAVAEATTPTGLQRILVPLANDGTVSSNPGTMTISVCPHRPISAVDDCSEESFLLAPLAPGAERLETIEWRRARYVGRIDIDVFVDTSNEDVHSSNRRRGSDYFVADVPGAGTCLPTCP